MSRVGGHTGDKLEGLGHVSSKIIGVGHLDFGHVGGCQRCLELRRQVVQRS